jgi:hypothetical protein
MTRCGYDGGEPDGAGSVWLTRAATAKDGDHMQLSSNCISATVNRGYQTNGHLYSIVNIT